jgi:hypothetical protein
LGVHSFGGAEREKWRKRTIYDEMGKGRVQGAGAVTS